MCYTERGGGPTYTRCWHHFFFFFFFAGMFLQRHEEDKRTHLLCSKSGAAAFRGAKLRSLQRTLLQSCPRRNAFWGMLGHSLQISGDAFEGFFKLGRPRRAECDVGVLLRQPPEDAAPEVGHSNRAEQRTGEPGDRSRDYGVCRGPGSSHSSTNTRRCTL